MPIKANYEDHAWVLEALKKAQEADHDNREKAREAVAFINERDGQWEDKWKTACADRPQYTFDLTNPMIEQITSSIAKNDYSIKVLPSGGPASKDSAIMYDGLVRHIEAISNASEVYSQSGRSMAVKGLDGWEVVQAYVDGDSFDQDLLIKKVPDWLDRVWLAPHTEQDGSDAPYAWKLAGLTKEEFEAKYPDRAQSSVTTDVTTTLYANRTDLIMVGTFYYKLPVEIELVRMSNDKVYKDDEEFDKIEDELTAAGITEIERRTRIVRKVYMRVFDNSGWIGKKAQETVFDDWIPLIPCYANFDYVEDKVIYWGAVEKMLDWQRVFNYSMSREIEEGAFAPRAKYWMTSMQAAGHETELETLNTNNDPVQLYETDPEAAGPPQYMGGAQINPGLRTLSETMQNGIGMGAGMFAAAMGDNPGLQSGVAIDSLVDRSDNQSNKYIEARKIAQRQTGRILVRAIPKVYKPGRVVRILAEDGSFDMETLGQEVIDQQSGKVVVLNDLSEGQFDVTCTAGPSFQTRQGATVSAMVQLGGVDPSVIEMGGDVIAQNINAPGMDIVAKRKRRQLFMSGALLPDELTDEERAEQQQMQGQQQPDPNMVLAMAEQQKAEADLITAQTKQQEAAVTAQQRTHELQIKAFEAETDRYKADIDRAKAMGEIKGKAAASAKLLAEAEAIDIENDVKKSGVHALAERLKGGMGANVQG